MTIETMLGINDYTLLVYYCSDTMYHFSIIDETGKAYTSETNFSTLSSAKFMGVCAIEKAVIDRDHKRR
ncbi:MAG: hypothetical protein Tsb0014_02550 [Pleurocapsa sp.]